MGKVKKEKVAVALSGGIDSAIAAVTLRDEGYNVIGLTMELWTDPYFKTSARHLSPVEKILYDAHKVASEIQIPHYTVELTDIFRKEVVDYFIEEYKAGRTPNPCIVCNPLIKFGKLFEKALALGAEKMATGHYVRSYFDEKRGKYILKKGIDKKKDQSYMLYRLNQAQLSRTLFPLGNSEKASVREKAAKLGLAVVEKSESQEICFIPGNDYRLFLENHGGSFPSGPIMDEKRNVIGKHNGLPFYTVGQRKGLGIAAGDPLYVIKILTAQNAIVVGNADDIYTKSFNVSDIHFIAMDWPSKPIAVNVRIRYHSEEVPATFYPGDKRGNARLELEKAQAAVTPGQSAVFYKEDEVLGGGVISVVNQG